MPDGPDGQTLHYASAPSIRELARWKLLLNLTLVCTGVAFLFAFLHVSTYVANAGSTCGTPVANSSCLAWLLAGGALLESIVVSFMALDARSPATHRRVLLLCMLANLICLSTPTLMEVRADYWPH